MSKQVDLLLKPEMAYHEGNFRKAVLKKTNLPDEEGITVRMLRRSVDARGKSVKVKVKAEVYVNETAEPRISEGTGDYPNVSNARRILVVGSGPAGLFAALRLIELGVKPVVIERGANVRERRRDLAAVNKQSVVNPESNYCFGEGGAGTYSDGKLYTRSKKRGDVNRILEILVAHGASDDILIDAHPHIGTNKLPKIVSELRESIIQAGGEVYFNTKLVDFTIVDGEVKGVTTQLGDRITGEGVILATGHSARDVFELLHNKGIAVEPKPFALGVRVEHQQSLIDAIQYNCGGDRGDYLPASSYSLVNQSVYKGVQRGVFSFCMCPGGFIVPSATSPGEVVVNGMSPSRRDSKYANSGIVVAVGLEDMKGFENRGDLMGMHFQKSIEQRACQIAGGTQKAPAQRLVDFVKGRVSHDLPLTSYQPGLTSVDMAEVLPGFITESLKLGFKAFGKKMKGYYTNDAQIVGVESRTSSPVKIPRDKQSLEHTVVQRLFPCGEGAGYAGGIVSAAIDGERCAEAIVQKYVKPNIID